jgi:hypothetical protein
MLFTNLSVILVLRVLGVQIENDVVHLRTSLVQLFAVLQLNWYK